MKTKPKPVKSVNAKTASPPTNEKTGAERAPARKIARKLDTTLSKDWVNKWAKNRKARKNYIAVATEIKEITAMAHNSTANVNRLIINVLQALKVRRSILVKELTETDTAIKVIKHLCWNEVLLHEFSWCDPKRILYSPISYFGRWIRKERKTNIPKHSDHIKISKYIWEGGTDRFPFFELNGQVGSHFKAVYDLHMCIDALSKALAFLDIRDVFHIISDHTLDLLEIQIQDLFSCQEALEAYEKTLATVLLTWS